jgi:hypothetical protein
MKFNQDWTFSLKNIFKLYRQILLKILTNVGLGFHPFSIDESEENEAKR